MHDKINVCLLNDSFPPVIDGVANAVVDVIHRLDPEREVKVACAEGLDNCKKMLLLAKAGKYDGYLLEGMACPGGCIAGAGTLLSLDQAAKSVALEQKNAARKNPLESEFSGLAEELNEF